MSIETNWYDYDAGYSVGTAGSDGGAIVRDEEHKSGARITLEEESGSAPFAVTCGIYGWMLHTRYFADEAEAGEEYEAMKIDLDKILQTIQIDEDADKETFKCITEEIALFVEKFP